jgi:hypothetical protein
MEEINHDFSSKWNAFLYKKFGNTIPNKFVLDLSEIDFIIPAVMATNALSWKAIDSHNKRIGVFS